MPKLPLLPRVTPSQSDSVALPHDPPTKGVPDVGTPFPMPPPAFQFLSEITNILEASAYVLGQGAWKHSHWHVAQPIMLKFVHDVYLGRGGGHYSWFLLSVS